MMLPQTTELTAAAAAAAVAVAVAVVTAAAGAGVADPIAAAGQDGSRG
jgi:hypothetical protein